MRVVKFARTVRLNVQVFLQMSQSYIDRFFVAGTNEQLMFHKRADIANNDAWWYRKKIKGNTGYISRSKRENERVLAGLLLWMSGTVCKARKRLD